MSHKHRALQYLSVSIVLLFLSFAPNQSKAQYGLVDIHDDTLSSSVFIHPVINGEMAGSEHEYKENLGLGDQLGRDFTIGKINDKGIVRRFKTDGSTNEDWYAWRKDVMAPFDGTIKKVNHPTFSNKPGDMDREALPAIFFLNTKMVQQLCMPMLGKLKYKKDKR